MIFETKKYGEVEAEVALESSSVDCYLSSGYSLTLDRELTDEELEEVQEYYADVIQLYAVEHGSSWD